MKFLWLIGGILVLSSFLALIGWYFVANTSTPITSIRDFTRLLTTDENPVEFYIVDQHSKFKLEMNPIRSQKEIKKRFSGTFSKLQVKSVEIRFTNLEQEHKFAWRIPDHPNLVLTNTSFSYSIENHKLIVNLMISEPAYLFSDHSNRQIAEEAERTFLAALIHLEDPETEPHLYELTQSTYINLSGNGNSPLFLFARSK